MTQQYQPGQRWISDGETEQGLGTVLTSDGRILTIITQPPEKLDNTRSVMLH